MRRAIGAFAQRSEPLPAVPLTRSVGRTRIVVPPSGHTGNQGAVSGQRKQARHYGNGRRPLVAQGRTIMAKRRKPGVDYDGWAVMAKDGTIWRHTLRDTFREVNQEFVLDLTEDETIVKVKLTEVA